MSLNFAIEGRLIGVGEPPYIIAELSGNHNGKIERAFELIAAAKTAGADAVKLQTYTADTMTIDHDGDGFVVDLPMWKGRRLHELYQEAHTPWDWHAALFAKARELGITIFSSPFDHTAVDLLESLGAPAYKIASFELLDIPLIERCAATGKPLIISTGMASFEEISDAVSAARKTGSGQIVLLQCVSAYPAPADEACLANISELRDRFGVLSGLSDHTIAPFVAIAAAALGASVIEKHVTLIRADGGVDAAFSLEPGELRQLVDETRTVFSVVSRPKFGPKPSEAMALKYRRTLYVVTDVAPGEMFTVQNVRAIRPGFGLPPKYLPDVLGRQASRRVTRGTPLQFDMVERRNRKDT